MNKKRRAVQSKQSKRLVNEARAWQNWWRHRVAFVRAGATESRKNDYCQP